MIPGPDGNIWFTEWFSNKIGTVFLQPALWQITGPDSGTLYNNVTFAHMENLVGGDVGANDFRFAATSTSSGSISGAVQGTYFGRDTLDESRLANVQVSVTGPGTFHGFKGTATNIGNGFDNIDTFVTAAQSAMKFDDRANTLPTTWTVTSSSVTRQVQGQLAETFPYSNITSLEIDSGTGGNTFYVQSTAAGTATTINSAGTDSVNVGNSTDGVGDIQGALSITNNPAAGDYTAPTVVIGCPR
jgi:hypothetical protein